MLSPGFNRRASASRANGADKGGGGASKGIYLLFDMASSIVLG